ncbi:hypothetical protein [Ralstonia sp. Ralssp135]|uniref:hypothetical protein n=1 Tax=Ralstonia sp. Ralssp135 TaxID=3243016 RepID=UPI0039AF8A56
MKFVHGDETDANLCRMLRHEYLRCTEALHDFAAAARRLQQGEQGRELAYRAYNSYARYIHHLYEFILACDQRTRGDASPIRGAVAEAVIATCAQRAFRLSTSSLNSAPLGASALSTGINVSLQEMTDFARALRKARNIAMGHVKHERASLNLSEFYGKYHKYLVALHRASVGAWGDFGEEFPDLGEVTAFSVLVKSTPASSIC